MHIFLHGIRRSVLEAWGLPCLPFVLLFKDGAGDRNEEGCLLPHPSGVDEEGDLLPAKGEGKQGNPLPANGAYEDGCLLPNPSGDDEDGCLLPNPSGVDEEGNPLPTNGEEEDGVSLPIRGDDASKLDLQMPTLEGQVYDGALRPTIGATHNGDFFPHFVDYLQIDAMHAWKKVLITYMHAEIGALGKALMVHDYLVIDHAKPRVDPKVKKETSLLLCLTINMPFHPGEYGHDGSPSSHHHKPYYYSPCLYIESSTPTSLSYPNPPSTLALHVNASLSDAAYRVKLPADPKSIYMPFTPLRGSKGYQGHTLQDNDEMKTASKTKMKKELLQAKLFSNDGITSLLLPLLRGSNTYQDQQKQFKVKVQIKMEFCLKLKTKDFMMLIIHAILDLG